MQEHSDYIIIRIHARLENNEKDIKEIKEKDLKEMNQKILRHDSDIYYFKQDMKTIKSDTQFIRRTITGAVITAAAGGAIGLIYQIVSINIGG